MINTSDKLYDELVFGLNKERDYTESEKNEPFIDVILKAQNQIDIFYIYSTQGLNAIRFLSTGSVVIWDFHYWDVFERYLIEIENCKYNNTNLKQCIIYTFTEFLSEKYIRISKICAFLKQVKEEFCEPILLPPEKYEKIDNIVSICKVFSFFHELGHLEYRNDNSDRILACKEMTLSFLSALNKEDLTDLEYWADLSWNTILAIKNGELESVLEELIADVFGIISTVDYFISNDYGDHFKLACNIAVAIEYLTTFQNVFNVVTKSWDSHYAEMKYGLYPKPKSSDSYVNKLEVTRNGIGNIILVVVINSMLHLNIEEREKLWVCRDENHVDTEQAIEYLSDDEYICTTIQEAQS